MGIDGLCRRFDVVLGAVTCGYLDADGCVGEGSAHVPALQNLITDDDLGLQMGQQMTLEVRGVTLANSDPAVRAYKQAPWNHSIILANASNPIHLLFLRPPPVPSDLHSSSTSLQTSL